MNAVVHEPSARPETADPVDADGPAAAPSLGARVVRWFVPVLPEARVAVLRSVLCVLVLIDIHLFVRDPPDLSHYPELYHPLLLARLLHLPAPSPLLTDVLYVVIWVGCLLGIVNRLPRLAGWALAASFTWWVFIGMSYGKVDHDHAALIVTLWLLPTVGPVVGRWRSTRRSAAAGWALRCTQFCVIATYFLSGITKLRNGDWDLSTWPDSAILTWAIVRRPFPLGLALLPHQRLLHLMQWGSILAELSSPVVLWLRGRALLGAALFWLGFHVFTLALLGIHFLPTVTCWLAFAPLERIAPWWDRRRAERRARRTGQEPSSDAAITTAAADQASGAT